MCCLGSHVCLRCLQQYSHKIYRNSSLLHLIILVVDIVAAAGAAAFFAYIFGRLFMGLIFIEAFGRSPYVDGKII